MDPAPVIAPKKMTAGEWQAVLEIANTSALPPLPLTDRLIAHILAIQEERRAESLVVARLEAQLEEAKKFIGNS